MTTVEILDAMPRLRALIVGDICLDRWCTYDPALADRSRETGLDRIAVTSVEKTPGGGGTVANNLAAFGIARVAVLGLAGDDGHGFELARALDQRGIESAGLIRSPLVTTFTYTKIINGVTGIEDRPRIDYVQAVPIPESLEREMARRLREIYAAFDVIFIADQAETAVGGVVTESLRTVLAEIGAASPGRIVWADSRLRSELFRNVTLKVNRSEADAACERAFGAVDYERLRGHLQATRVFVTDGRNGTIINDQGRVTQVATRPIENPVDICGAGDSFSSGAACALAAGATPEQAAQLGNLWASVTVMKRGTGTANRSELERQLAQDVPPRA